jgi:hypothetical protein
MQRPKKLPRDANALAARIVALSTGQVESAKERSGRLGGLKGGKARASKLSAEERTRIAQQAARARWKKGQSKS